MTLHLGKIDDFDVTYLNGKLVSKGAGADNLRAYPVAASDVKAGTAVLSVRVNDTGGGGGMHGDKSNFYAEIEGRRIPLYGDWKYKSIVDYKSLGLSSAPLGTSSFPTVLYNAMLHPLHVMPIQGVIWYQGCANVGRDEQYAPLFQTMIKNWRSLWGRNFPFYFVQLAGFQAAHPLQPNSAWTALRNAQSKALALPNTGMAVAIDLGNPVDIHPKNKQEVARRLSLLALGNTYGQPVESVAPQLKSFDCKGGKVTLHFDKAVQPTMSVLTGFIIGDKDGNFAQAVATQADKYTIVVSSDVVKSPSIVRYDWADYPSGNLYGATGLPVAPFATDK